MDVEEMETHASEWDNASSVCKIGFSNSDPLSGSNNSTSHCTLKCVKVTQRDRYTRKLIILWCFLFCDEFSIS